MITVGSIFRNSTGYHDRYFDQIAKLEAAIGEPVRLVIAEGDSDDGSYPDLYQRTIDREWDRLLKVDHGGRHFGSVDHPQRWAQVALVCNAVMVAAEPSLDGPMIYVESDLIWEPATMIQLLEDLAVVPAAAPLSMTGGRFYDIWGHRGMDGQPFNTIPPYHPSLDTDAPLVQIGSAGSCVVMREEVARVARFGENDCIVGLGREIRHKAEASLWLDRRVSVEHP